MAAEAKLRTRKKPHMSVQVVRMGLDARAGSALNRFKISGMRPPSRTETMVLRKRAPPIATSTMPATRYTTTHLRRTKEKNGAPTPTTKKK